VEPLITVVIPTYKGESHVSACASAVLSSCADLPVSILFVDDGSPDRTWEQIYRLNKALPQVSGIRLAENYGQQTATFAGLIRVKTPWAVTMDDDLSHNPDDIPRLLEEGKKGYDLVYAVPKNSPGCRKTRSFSRKAGTLLHDILFFFLFPRYGGIRITSFRIMNSRIIQNLKKYPRRFIYVSGIALSTGPKVSQIEVHSNNKPASRYSYWKLSMLFLRLALHYSPLRHILPKSGKTAEIKTADTLGLQK